MVGLVLFSVFSSSVSSAAVPMRNRLVLISFSFPSSPSSSLEEEEEEEEDSLPSLMVSETSLYKEKNHIFYAAIEL